MSDVMVTLTHARSALPRRCTRGMRHWCKANGIDWGSFVRNGIRADELEAKGDALIAPVIALARAEAADGR